METLGWWCLDTRLEFDTRQVDMIMNLWLGYSNFSKNDVYQFLAFFQF